MEDYIEILLNEMGERWSEYLSREYYFQKDQEDRAMEALLETLTEEQRTLFLRYEEHRNAAGVFYNSCMTRQAFLLAREIFR